LQILGYILLTSIVGGQVLRVEVVNVFGFTYKFKPKNVTGIFKRFNLELTKNKIIISYEPWFHWEGLMVPFSLKTIFVH